MVRAIADAHAPINEVRQSSVAVPDTQRAPDFALIASEFGLGTTDEGDAHVANDVAAARAVLVAAERRATERGRRPSSAGVGRKDRIVCAHCKTPGHDEESCFRKDPRRAERAALDPRSPFHEQAKRFLARRTQRQQQQGGASSTGPN